eukprot:1157015-Pelagomonas_calceolata.AAC.1
MGVWAWMQASGISLNLFQNSLKQSLFRNQKEKLASLECLRVYEKNVDQRNGPVYRQTCPDASKHI